MDARSVIQPILDHIEDNLCAELTAQELAARAGLSAYHFQRVFRRIVGFPVAQYIRRRRLLHAVCAIRCGQTGVQAALRYGYATYSGFYRAFVREFGCTPTAYLHAGHATHPRRQDLYKELTATVLANWQLSHLPTSDVYYESTGERNEHALYVGTDYVLKFSADQNRLLTHMQLSAALERQGLLAASPILTTGGEALLPHKEGWFFLSRRLPGRPLRAAELVTGEGLALTYTFGAQLGKLHLALSNLELPAEEAAAPADTLAWALPRVRDVLPLPAGLSHEMHTVLTTLSPMLPRQIIHRDPNPSNVLVSDEGWSFIDFELSQRSIRLYDPCYAATAVLSETIAFADGSMLHTWTDFYHALLRGYDSTACLTPEEKTVLPYLLLTDQFRCLAWFADQTQYPDLFAVNKRMTAWLLDHFDELRFS